MALRHTLLTFQRHIFQNCPLPSNKNEIILLFFAQTQERVFYLIFLKNKINYIYFAGRLRTFLRTLPDGSSGKIYLSEAYVPSSTPEFAREYKILLVCLLACLLACLSVRQFNIHVLCTFSLYVHLCFCVSPVSFFFYMYYEFGNK